MDNKPPSGDSNVAGSTSAAPSGEKQQGDDGSDNIQSEPHIDANSNSKGTEECSGKDSLRWPCGSDEDELYALRSVTGTSQPFGGPPSVFSPGPQVLQQVAECKVLVVGAGGLGCELLKTLCLSGFRSLSVLDLDVVSVSNLHRQFLFRDEHVGQPKAEVAAQVLNKRFKHLGVKIEAHCCKLQEKPLSFLQGFDIIIGGLDCVETRRWLNGRVHELVQRDSDGRIIVDAAPLLLDGGTEGLRGQMRLCIAGVTACYECGIGTLPPQVTYPLCTIASTPRQPEHCIQYCLAVQWPKEHPEEAIDLDNPDHLSWLFEASKARAEEYGIEGVTYRLTTGVAKHIVPAVASTNAVVAALLVQEAFRYKTFCCCSSADRNEDGELENYIMFSGDSQVYMHTFGLERRSDCFVCGRRQVELTVERSWTLSRLVEELRNEKHLNKPSVKGPEDFLYIQNPPSLRAQHEWKLDLTLAELIEKGYISEGQPLLVTDPSLPSAIELSIVFSDAQPEASGANWGTVSGSE